MVRDSYGDIVRDRLASSKNITGKPLTIRALSHLLNKSYEHCRNIAKGEAVVSEALNRELCRILNLDADRMWQLAAREKAAKRYGSAIVDAPDIPDNRIAELWRHLSLADRHRLVRFAEALAASEPEFPVQLPFSGPAAP